MGRLPVYSVGPFADVQCINFFPPPPAPATSLASKTILLSPYCAEEATSIVRAQCFKKNFVVT